MIAQRGVDLTMKKKSKSHEGAAVQNSSSSVASHFWDGADEEDEEDEQEDLMATLSEELGRIPDSFWGHFDDAVRAAISRAAQARE